jgi:hypothetical protein
LMRTEPLLGKQAKRTEPTSMSLKAEVR